MRLRLAEASRLIHGVDGDHLFPYPLQELWARKLLRGLDGTVVGRDGEVHVHVQAKLEDMAHWRVQACQGRRLRW